MRILFTSSPGWGHVHPLVPLAQAFLARGDDVLWCTGADSAGRLAAEGIPAVSAGLDAEVAMGELFRRYPEVKDVAPAARSDFMFPRLFGMIKAPAMVADLAPIAREWSPDLVVCDTAEFAGPLIAAELGIPAVSHAFGGLLPEPRVAATSEAVEGLWKEAGLDPRPYGGMYDHLYLDIFPPSLQPAERPHVSATQLLRPGAFATAGDEVTPDWVTSSTGTPLVYVTLGTVFSNDAALVTVVEGVAALDARVVVTVGPHGDPAVLGAQPSNVHVARYIPQEQLLPACAAVVSHGGSGTFLAALAAGLPQVCVPQGADQFFNAAAAVRSGVGFAFPPDEVGVTEVRGAVQQLLTESAYAAAARRIGTEIAAMPEARTVAGALAQRFG